MAYLALITEENMLAAMVEHDTPDMVFVARGIGDKAGFRNTAAGKEEHIRIKVPDKILCICAYIGRRVMQHAATGAIYRMLV